MTRIETGTGDRGSSPEALSTSWYARPELAGPWRIPACRAHGPALEAHRFAATTAPPAREGALCGVCERPELLREVERCTCEYDSARCPEHRILGCGG